MSARVPTAVAQEGFTLLEILAAIAVLGLILGVLAGGLRYMGQVRHMYASDTVAANQIVPVDSTLRLLIEKAWPGARGMETQFTGGENTLSFRTQMPDGLVAIRTRDAQVTIGVDKAHRLYLTWLPWYRNWIVAQPRSERIDLLTNVDRVEFSYWDPSLKLPPNTWVSAWIGASVPKLLRIRLIFDAGSGLRWPDIVVATNRDPWDF
jgi:general secretion pathway protein J